MLEATHAHHRAVVELQGLFARKGGELSPHFLTGANHFEEIFLNSDRGVKSFAVLNFSAVTIYLGLGGASATAGNGFPIAATSFLQLPVETNEVKIACPAAELEGVGQAMVAFVRYRHLVNLAGGPLSSGAVSAAAGVAAVTAGSPRSVVVGVATAVVIPANPTRKGLSIENTGEGNVSLGLGNPAIVGDDVVLQPGGSWDGTISGRLWQGAVNSIAAAPSSLAVVEV